MYSQWHSQPDNLVPLCKFQSIITIHFGYLENANIENADLVSADMENADMENADMENADMENADKHFALSGVQFGLKSNA